MGSDVIGGEWYLGSPLRNSMRRPVTIALAEEQLTKNGETVSDRSLGKTEGHSTEVRVSKDWRALE